MPWHELEPKTLHDAASAPSRLDFEARSTASPERVFEVLVTSENRGVWFPEFIACSWLSAPPHGIGSTREVELKTLSAREKVVAFEPGRHFAFVVTALSVPILDFMVEEFVFEPDGRGGTVGRCRVYYSVRSDTAALHPIERFFFGTMFKNALEGLMRYAEQPTA